MKPIKNSLYIILCTVAVGLLVYYALIRPLKKQYETRHVAIHGLYMINPVPIENFELVDQNEKIFTKENLRGHWSLLFFGFTHCTMVCPVTFASLNQFYQRIEKKLSEKDRPQIVFITIDPDRDTSKTLKKYLLQFNRHFIGARTTPEKMEIIKNQFHVIAEKNTPGSDQFNHTTDILLINPKAEIQAWLYFPQNPLELELDYMKILLKQAD
ncbi:MAG TPA: SCO family protein [Gammaproteobacteria bacterium]|nr:SCO family protein [Gammaproteobacteria bacterium]